MPWPTVPSRLRAAVALWRAGAKPLRRSKGRWPTCLRQAGIAILRDPAPGYDPGYLARDLRACLPQAGGPRNRRAPEAGDQRRQVPATLVEKAKGVATKYDRL